MTSAVEAPASEGEVSSMARWRSGLVGVWGYLGWAGVPRPAHVLVTENGENQIKIYHANNL